MTHKAHRGQAWAGIGLLLFSLAAGGVVAAENEQTVTYSKDVAPILENRCVVCHRTGQIAPMSLRSYAEVRPWAKAIAQRVAAREMPPFHAAGPIGRYKNDPRLTDEEVRTIVAWVEEGATRGDPAHLPERRVFQSKEWFLGPPDIVLTFAKYTVRRDGKDDNVLLYTDYVFEEDLWVKGSELNPSNDRVVHHANVFIVPPKAEVPDSLVTHDRMNIAKFDALLAWTPGLNPSLLPGRQAIKITKGSRLVMQTHFAPTSDTIEEETAIGLYFADGVVDPNGYKNLASLMPDLVVEPHDDHSLHTDRQEFRSDALVTHFKFHMHYRGKSCMVVFHYPDGTSETAIDVPTWDFDWQQEYHLNEPIRVPKGTVAEFVGVWDNSAANPLNPDPSKRVKWGLRSRDEMYGGNVYYTPADTDPQAFLTVSNGREVTGGD